MASVQRRKYVMLHPAGTSDESDIFEGFTNFWFSFYSGDLWENIFGSIKNKEYICLKNNTTQSYCILGRGQLRWIFSSLLRDVPDISNSAHD